MESLFLYVSNDEGRKMSNWQNDVFTPTTVWIFRNKLSQYVEIQKNGFL